MTDTIENLDNDQLDIDVTPEYLRQLAEDTARSGANMTASDINAAADKIDELSKLVAQQGESLRGADMRENNLREKADGIEQEQFQFQRALFDQISDRIDRRIEQIAEEKLDEAFRDFDIHDHDSEIESLVDDALDNRGFSDYEPEDPDTRREEVESIVRSVLSGATITIDF